LATDAEVLRGKLTTGWEATRSQAAAKDVLHKTIRGTAAYIDEWENRYHLNRSILRFSLSGIPAGANIKSGELWIWPYSDSAEKICFQAAPGATWLDISDYSKMEGVATEPVIWSTGRKVLSLSADIISDLNTKIGANAYLMTRDYTYDYMEAKPPAGTYLSLEYYIYVTGHDDKTPVLRLTYEA